MKRAVDEEPGNRFRTLHALRCRWVFGAIALSVFACATLSFAQGYNLGAFWRPLSNTPIALVQSAGDSQDSPTVTMPGASKPGDLIVVTVWGEATTSSEFAGTTVTDSFGNSYTLAASSTFAGYGYTGLFYAKNILAPTSAPIVITVNFPNLTNGDDGDPAVSAAEFSGIDRNSPLDQTANSTEGAASTPSSATSGTTPTTAKAYELLVATISGDNDGFILFSPTGSPLFTSLTNQEDDYTASAGAFEYAIVAATGNYGDTWSMSAFNDEIVGYAGAIATFKGLQLASNLPVATKVVMTSAPQSVQTHQCSGAVTMVSENASNQPTHVGADQPVTLSGTGLNFYSDSGCTQAISSITFTSSASTTQSFYLAATTPGTITLTGTPSTFATVTQNETITLVNGTWLGNGGNSNWSNASNWSGGAVPTGTAIFDSNCISCNATMDSVVADSSLTTYSTYSGTITDTATSATLYNLQLVGGTLNGGSGTLIVEGGFTYSPTATFNAQTGTVQLGDANSASFALISNGGSPTFNNVIFNNPGTQAWAATYVGGNWYVTGTMTINNATTGASNNLSIDSPYGGALGVIYVAGNLTANTGGGGKVNIVLNGNNNTQTLTGAAAGVLPYLTIAHTGTGGVNLAGTIVFDRDFTQTSGTVNPGTSTIQMGRGDSTRDQGATITVNTMNFYNLTLKKAAGEAVIGEGTYNVASAFTVSSSAAAAYFSCGSTAPIVNLSGNLSLGTQGLGAYCNANFNFVGTNAQTISSAGGALQAGSVEIAKTGGSVSLSSNVTSPSTNWTVHEGSLSLNGYVLNVGGNFDIDAAGTLNCNGGCGGTPGSPSPPASMPSGCGFGTGDLLCAYLDNSNGGVINP